MLHADLHCHSTASDGELSPTALVEKAAELNVELLALTDHDTLAGQSEARETARRLGLDYVNGVEITADWNGQMLHIVGLAYDDSDVQLKNWISLQQLRRAQRAEQIAVKLEKLGLDSPLATATQYADGGVPGRPHFARAIVDAGLAPNTQKVFKRYLVPGKPGYVKQAWPDLVDVVETIHAAGGVAVFAHPTRYKMSATKLRGATQCFAEVGGDAIELISGPMPPNEVQHAVTLAKRFGLAGSQGSDFHGGQMPWLPLGVRTPFPSDVKPVWELFA